MATETDTDRAEGQARAQLESIREMVKALEEDIADAEETIQEDPLEVSIRSDWHTPGEEADTDTEYKILLCTGGPAVRIIGQLGKWNEPETAEIQYQDWFTPWVTLPTDSDEEAAMLTYARQFYYGDS